MRADQNSGGTESWSERSASPSAGSAAPSWHSSGRDTATSPARMFSVASSPRPYCVGPHNTFAELPPFDSDPVSQLLGGEASCAHG